MCLFNHVSSWNESLNKVVVKKVQVHERNVRKACSLRLRAEVLKLGSQQALAPLDLASRRSDTDV